MVTGPLQEIKNALQSSAISIHETQSIAGAWAILTGRGPNQLGWTHVIASKSLHFLCRALGFKQNPPSAIDNKVILERLWPKFVTNISLSQRPKDWRGNSLDAYYRYMTAILVWAEQRRWTTTDMEATIFAEYSR